MVGERHDTEKFSRIGEAVKLVRWLGIDSWNVV
jgi:hypothetical protein